jgi:hypothetical protein
MAKNSLGAEFFALKHKRTIWNWWRSRDIFRKNSTRKDRVGIWRINLDYWVLFK